MSFVAGIICGHIHKSKYPLFFANSVGNIKCLAYGKFAIMEYGSGSCRFFGFAFCTPPGMRRFARTGIGIPAFTTCKSVFPFKIGQEFKTFIIIVKQLIQLCFRYFFIKKRFHDRCIHTAKIKKIVISKRFK